MKMRNRQRLESSETSGISVKRPNGTETAEIKQSDKLPEMRLAGVDECLAGYLEAYRRRRANACYSRNQTSLGALLKTSKSDNVRKLALPRLCPTCYPMSGADCPPSSVNKPNADLGNTHIRDKQKESNQNPQNTEFHPCSDAHFYGKMTKTTLCMNPKCFVVNISPAPWNIVIALSTHSPTSPGENSHESQAKVAPSRAQTHCSSASSKFANPRCQLATQHRPFAFGAS